MRTSDTSLPRSPLSTAPTTPPPDLEADREKCYLLEEHAREDLEKDGCPPCYPTDPTFLLQDPSAQYIKIKSYWEVSPMAEGGIFCAQRKDWKAFRRFQERNRRHYLQRKTFAELETKIHERRRKYKLEGDVYLHPDPMQQSRLENWIEFQDYHLQIHEELEKKVQSERECLDITRTKSKDADSFEAGHVALCMEAYEVRFASAASKMKSHEDILLQWIEQQRIMMIVTQAASCDYTGNYNDQKDTIRTEPTSYNQKKKTKARSLLSPVQSGVSKHAPQKRSPSRQKSGLLREAENVLTDSGVIQSMLRTPKLRKCKSRSVKGNTPLLPFNPQKVTKTARKASGSKQPADINVNLHLTSRLRTTKQRNSTERIQLRNQRSAQMHPTNIYLTRSGRKSRRPEQPDFVSSEKVAR